jgi:hypothetical protein
MARIAVSFFGETLHMCAAAPYKVGGGQRLRARRPSGWRRTGIDEMFMTPASAVGQWRHLFLLEIIGLTELVGVAVGACRQCARREPSAESGLGHVPMTACPGIDHVRSADRASTQALARRLLSTQ